MPGFLDLMDMFNLVDRLEGLMSSLINADWKNASRRSGGAGVVTELGRTLVGANTWSFSIPRDAGWTGTSIEQFLKHYGIKVWGRRVTSQHFHFSVEERQANWAEYLLLRRGIPVEGRLFNPQNAAYGRQHAPGDQPPAWADRQRSRSLLDRLSDLL